MADKRIIAIVSGKGGVGKSTVAVNIASLLSTGGASTLLMDMDFYNPSVYFHLGIAPHSVVGLVELLERKAQVEDVLSIHPATGLRCISSSLRFRRRVPSKHLKKILSELDYRYILLDCPPGLSEFVEDAIDVADELFVLMTPDIPSVAAGIKLLEIVKKKSHLKKIHLILNRVRSQPYEIHPQEIVSLCKKTLSDSSGCELQIIVPEDTRVLESLAMKAPVVLAHPDSPAAEVFRRFCKEEFSVSPGISLPLFGREGPFQRLLHSIRRFLHLH